MKLIELLCTSVELASKVNWACRVEDRRLLNVRTTDLKYQCLTSHQNAIALWSSTKLDNEYGWCRHSINVCWIECNENDKRDITNAFFKTSLHVPKDVFDILSTFLVTFIVAGTYNDRVPYTTILWITGCRVKTQAGLQYFDSDGGGTIHITGVDMCLAFTVYIS